MSSQRRTLKSLAKTPHSLFGEEDIPVVVGKALDKEVEGIVEGDTKTEIEESGKDVNFSDTEYPQCKNCDEYHSEWIRCESGSCRVEWYGLDCSQVTDIPAGKWLCAICRPRAIFPNLPGAPKQATSETSQQTTRGVTIKKRTSKTAKPGWRGYIEISREVEDKMHEEADARWKVNLELKRTRGESKNRPSKPTRRLRRGNEISVRRSLSPEVGRVEEADGDSCVIDDRDLTQEQESNIGISKRVRRLRSGNEIHVRRSPSREVSELGEASTPKRSNGDANLLDYEDLAHEPEIRSDTQAERQEDERSSNSAESEVNVRGTADNQLAKELAASLKSRVVMPIADSVIASNEEGMVENKEAESSEGNEIRRTYSDTTFEGFSDSEMTDDDSDVQQPSVIVGGNLAPSSEQLTDDLNDVSEEQDSEMTDEIEFGIEEMSVVDGVEETESLSFSESSTDEAAKGQGPDRTDDLKSTSNDFADVGIETAGETLGVGTDDYRYLDLSPYGSFLVRSSS